MVLRKPGVSGNVLATLAIGDMYLDNFNKYALSSWLMYCNQFDLGLVLFDEQMIDINSENWKKPNWQKLLIGECLKKYDKSIANVCYLDTDILISPLAPNIFDFHESEKISVVSQINNLPYPEAVVKRRIAFNRHNFYSDSYPLDSALFASLDQIYGYHNLPSQSDYFCTGVYVFNLENHADMMAEWFYKYPKNIKTLTNGGEEAVLNYELQKYGALSMLPYEFQSLWNYEMAWKYPFLYWNRGKGADSDSLIRQCIQSSLLSNHFLHFAGSWYESDMWKMPKILDENMLIFFQSYDDYLRKDLTGKPVGMVKPVTTS